MPYYNHVWIYALDNRRVNTCWFTELKHHRVEELYGIQWLLPRLQFHSWWGSSVFIQPRPKCIFCPKSYSCILASMRTSGAGCIPACPGWDCRQSWSWGVDRTSEPGREKLLVHSFQQEMSLFTRLSSEGGKRAFSIISALMKPELYFHPSPGLTNTFWDVV